MPRDNERTGTELRREFSIKYDGLVRRVLNGRTSARTFPKGLAEILLATEARIANAQPDDDLTLIKARAYETIASNYGNYLNLMQRLEG